MADWSDPSQPDRAVLLGLARVLLMLEDADWPTKLDLQHEDGHLTEVTLTNTSSHPMLRDALPLLREWGDLDVELEVYEIPWDGLPASRQRLVPIGWWTLRLVDDLDRFVDLPMRWPLSAVPVVRHPTIQEG